MTTMLAPNTKSNFTIRSDGGAWWLTLGPAERGQYPVYVCSVDGVKMLVALQAMLRDVLGTGWTSFDRLHDVGKALKVDGAFGGQTIRALWEYARQAAMPGSVLNALQDAAKKETMTEAVTAVAAMALYYAPRLARTPEGFTTLPPRMTGMDPQRFYTYMPEGAVFWPWGKPVAGPLPHEALAVAMAPTCTFTGQMSTGTSGLHYADPPPAFRPNPPIARERAGISGGAGGGGGRGLLPLVVLIGTVALVTAL